MAASVEQKLAAQYKKNQSAVWTQVANSKHMLDNALAGYPANPTVVARLENTLSPGADAGGLPYLPARDSAVAPNPAFPTPPVVVVGIAPTFTPGAGGGGFGGNNNLGPVLIGPILDIAEVTRQTAQNQRVAGGEASAVNPTTGLPTPFEVVWSGQASVVGDSTSLQLALENKTIQKLVKEYVDQMERQLKAQKSPVGIAVAINGKVVSADIYGQPALFAALWPKLINAAATEAGRQV
jgi:hypothetical protein